MRITKVKPWFSYVASAVVGASLMAAVHSFLEFSAYEELQAFKRAQTEAPNEIVVFEEAEQLCASLPESQRFHCFKEQALNHRSELRAQADLIAQQDMALWAFGVLLISLFGFFVSAGGFGALVWTFMETRKMTRAQDRAYLLIGPARIFHDPTYGLTYALEVQNSGNTPATFVSAKLVMTITYPDQTDHTIARTDQHTIVCALNEVSAKDRGYLDSGHISAILTLPDSLLVSHGSHYRKTGTIIGTGDLEEDGIDARIDVAGNVIYFDVFGEQHELRVHQYSMSLEDDNWGLRNSSSFSMF